MSVSNPRTEKQHLLVSKNEPMSDLAADTHQTQNIPLANVSAQTISISNHGPFKASSKYAINLEVCSNSKHRQNPPVITSKTSTAVKPSVSKTDTRNRLRIQPPMRDFDCMHYDTCLSLAAALNWDSFTCQNCSGEVNQQLLWRAHYKTKEDKELAALCELPDLSL